MYLCSRPAIMLSKLRSRIPLITFPLFKKNVFTVPVWSRDFHRSPSLATTTPTIHNPDPPLPQAYLYYSPSDQSRRWLEEHGIRITHILSNSLVIVTSKPKVQPPPDLLREVIDDSILNSLDETSQLMVKVFRLTQEKKHQPILARKGTRWPSKPPNLPKSVSSWEEPQPELPPPRVTEQLRDKVLLYVVFVQGTSTDGKTNYSFDQSEVARYMAAMTKKTLWLASVNPRARLQFTFDSVYSIVDANPGIPDGTWTAMEKPWLDPTLLQVGGTPGDSLDEASIKIAEKMLLSKRHNYCGVVFLTKYPLKEPGYANGAGMIIQCPLPPPFETEEFPNVFAHELLHLFGALDEDPDFCHRGKGGFYQIWNWNCKLTPADHYEDCVMSETDKRQICPYTRGQIGWDIWSKKQPFYDNTNVQGHYHTYPILVNQGENLIFFYIDQKQRIFVSSGVQHPNFLFSIPKDTGWTVSLNDDDRRISNLDVLQRGEWLYIVHCGDNSIIYIGKSNQLFKNDVFNRPQVSKIRGLPGTRDILAGGLSLVEDNSWVHLLYTGRDLAGRLGICHATSSRAQFDADITNFTNYGAIHNFSTRWPFGVAHYKGKLYLAWAPHPDPRGKVSLATWTHEDGWTEEKKLVLLAPGDWSTFGVRLIVYYEKLYVLHQIEYGLGGERVMIISQIQDDGTAVRAGAPGYESIWKAEFSNFGLDTASGFPRLWFLTKEDSKFYYRTYETGTDPSRSVIAQ